MYELAHSSIRVRVDDRLGGEIVQVWYRDRPLLASYDWVAPVGVSASTSYGDEKLDWLSEYRGGWQLLVPNAGAACVVDGVPLPFHGEWSRTRVDVTDHRADRIRMEAGTRLPLRVEREIRIEVDPERVIVSTTVSNTVNERVPFVWGEHPAFAVGPGDHIELPAGEVVSREGQHLGRWPGTSATPPLDRIDSTAPRESVHYVSQLAEGWAAVRRADVGIGLAWDVDDFPYTWLWYEIASAGFPFYGRTSLVAIEPNSSAPGDGLAQAIANGQAFALDAHQSRSTEVVLVPFEANDRAVRRVRPDGVEFVG